MARRAPSILFIHDNFPAQFGGLGRWLAAQGLGRRPSRPRRP